jgi:hypothetical protein
MNGFLEEYKRKKIDMRSGIWNARSFCRTGSLTTVARKLAK